MNFPYILKYKEKVPYISVFSLYFILYKEKINKLFFLPYIFRTNIRKNFSLSFSKLVKYKKK